MVSFVVVGFVEVMAVGCPPLRGHGLSMTPTERRAEIDRPSIRPSTVVVRHPCGCGLVFEHRRLLLT